MDQGMLETGMPRRKKPTNNIREYRHRLSYTGNTLAKAMDCYPNMICKWERERSNPSLRSVLRLSAALKVPVEILFLDRFKKYRKEIEENIARHRKWEKEQGKRNCYFGTYDWERPGK